MSDLFTVQIKDKSFSYAIVREKPGATEMIARAVYKEDADLFVVAPDLLAIMTGLLLRPEVTDRKTCKLCLNDNREHDDKCLVAQALAVLERVEQ